MDLPDIVANDVPIPELTGSSGFVWAFGPSNDGLIPFWPGMYLARTGIAFELRECMCLTYPRTTSLLERTGREYTAANESPCAKGLSCCGILSAQV
jgi:hypothetical protein